MNKIGYIIIALISAGIVRAEISKQPQPNIKGKHVPSQQDSSKESISKIPSNAFDFNIRKNRGDKRQSSSIKLNK
jgi:hypothetical protein